MSTRYSLIGLGKLGASMAAAIADQGHEVVGVDVDQETVDLVNEGKAPVHETDLDATLRANRDRIRATKDHREAVLETDVSFVVVPTPSDEDGAFSLQYASWAFREIGQALRDKDEHHLVVLTSTVLPGSTRYGLLPGLEEASGKTPGEDFGLCYSPEFIALGSVIEDFLNPDFTLVGEYDEDSGRRLERVYGELLENDPPCKRMSLENAELAKIAVNTYVTTKITFGNMLADLCERVPGGDVDAVTDALGEDHRIGHEYLTGALGYGGPCFPRDNVALGHFAQQLDTRADLAETTDRVNREIPDRLLDRLGPAIGDGETVAVLGLAYKPHSHIVEESQGVLLARRLSKRGARVVAYDPLAKATAEDALKDQAVVLDSVEDCLAQADTVVVANPDPEFEALTAKDFLAERDGVQVVDVWRLLDDELRDVPGIDYAPVGRADRRPELEERLIELWDGRAAASE